MKGVVILVIGTSLFFIKVFSQCNKTKLEQCLNIAADAIRNSSSADFQSAIKMYCSPSYKSTMVCYMQELMSCPDYLANFNAAQRSYLQNVSINYTSYLNTYCSTMQDLSPEFIACFSIAFNVTFPPTPGGYLDCLRSDPAYHAFITSGHPVMDVCPLQALSQKCALQKIHEYCPGQVSDFNNYYHLVSATNSCPNVNDVDKLGLFLIMYLVSSDFLSSSVTFKIKHEINVYDTDRRIISDFQTARYINDE